MMKDSVNFCPASWTSALWQRQVTQWQGTWLQEFWNAEKWTTTTDSWHVATGWCSLILKQAADHSGGQHVLLGTVIPEMATAPMQATPWRDILSLKCPWQYNIYPIAVGIMNHLLLWDTDFFFELIKNKTCFEFPFKAFNLNPPCSFDTRFIFDQTPEPFQNLQLWRGGMKGIFLSRPLRSAGLQEVRRWVFIVSQLKIKSFCAGTFG